MTLTVAVLGNCQAESVAASLQAMLDGAHVWHCNWGKLRSLDGCAFVADRACEADIVFTQIAAWEKTGPLQTHLLRARARHLVTYPKFHFSGLQPDAIWINKGVARGPIGSSFHSKLILAAFLKGLAPAHAATLFNAYFYTLLGYFDEYEKTVAFNVASALEHGVDLSDQIEQWRPRVFMHAPTHPKIEVLWAIAEACAKKAGLDPRGDDTLPQDPLDRAAQWPVYPEIAERLGVDGALEFRLGDRADRAVWRLDQVVKRAYASYESANQDWLRRVPDVARAIDTLERAGV